MIQISDYKQLIQTAATMAFSKMDIPNKNFHFGYVEDFNKLKTDAEALATIIVQYPERWPMLRFGDLDGGTIRQRVFMGTRMYNDAALNIDALQQFALYFIEAVDAVDCIDMGAAVVTSYPIEANIYPSGYLVNSDAVISFDLNIKLWQCRQ